MRTLLEVATWGGIIVAVFPFVYNAFMEAIFRYERILSRKKSLLLIFGGLAVFAVGVSVQVKMYY